MKVPRRPEPVCRPQADAHPRFSAVDGTPLAQDAKVLDVARLKRDLLAAESRIRGGGARYAAQARGEASAVAPAAQAVDSLIAIGKEARRQGQTWQAFYREHALNNLYDHVRTKIRVACGFPSPRGPHEPAAKSPSSKAAP